MGADLSAERLCDYRCFGSIDTLNNHFAGSGLRPKYLIADCDTYHKFPGDDIYPNVPVKYLRLDRVPGPEALEQRDLLLQQSGCAGPGRRHSARACLPAA